MTDTGAVIRALKLGHPTDLISKTLGITPESVEFIAKEFDEIKAMCDEGASWEEASSRSMKERGEVWYAYHVIETSNEELEEEIKAENIEGKERLKPPRLEDEPPAPKEKPKGGRGGGKKDTKKVTKEKINEGLREKGETPTGEALMERTGKIAVDLALKEQQLGQHVMDTMDPTMREFGYKDPIDFIQMIYDFFLENNSKVGHIQELEGTIETLTALLDERNRKAFIAKQTDTHILELVSRGLPVVTDNLLAYAKFLELQIPQVNIELNHGGSSNG